jgi:ubiquinone/menaquinone biosynthesis C-methylase UbiE
MLRSDPEGKAGYLHGADRDEQARLARFNEATNQAFVEFLDLAGVQAVLEVGSGLGILTNLIAKRLPHGTVIGLESSAEHLRSAKAGAANLRFHQGDGHALPFPDNSFDLVYCRWVLEHVREPVRVVQEMRRVLKPGCKAYVVENDVTLNRLYPSTPTFDRLWSVEIPALQAALGGDAKIGSRLYALFVSAGFQNVELSIQPEVHWFGSPGFRAWVENLAAILRGASSGLIARGVERERIEVACKELEQLLSEPTASAIFHFGRACGRK